MSNEVSPCSNRLSEGRPLWCLVSGQALRHHEWQGEYVLYNDISGDTHFLDESAMRLLRRLQAAPADAGAVRELLFDSGDADVAGAEAATLLSELDALVLIEQVA